MGLFELPFFLRRRRAGRLKLEVLEPARRYFTRDQILVLPLAGLVNVGTADELMGRSGMLMTLKDRLKAALDNDRLRAVILKIDSPGGEVTASDLIHRELLEFKRKRKIPLLAWLGSMATSGGLYIAMAADEIYALPTTVTGSIGVIAMLPGLEGLSAKIGLEMRVIKSGANKDLGSPWQAMTEDQRRIFEDLVAGMNHRFREVVVDSRGEKGLALEKFYALADGRILDAQSAWAIHLIDGIKYPDEIVARAREVAGLDDARLVSYEYAGRFRGNIYAQWPAAGAAGLVNAWWGAALHGAGLPGLAGAALWGWGALPEGPRPVFMYLWLP